MENLSMSNRRYTYLHDCKRPLEAIDTHHVILRRSHARGFLVFLFAILLLANALCLFLIEDKLLSIASWSILLSGFIVMLLHRKLVEKESVVIMPTFGVQLETHYVSGKVTRRFVPIDNILKPLLLECVTPITCYWSLSLLVWGEEELMLVFKVLHPPLKMLVPIWKALCAATGNEKSTGTVYRDS